MAYSDYGGYAYRNGARVEERSDAVLSPEGIKSTPGMWPGWLLEEGRSGGSFHVLLGDGPIFVGLRKQSTVRVFRLGEELDVTTLLVDPKPEEISEYSTERYLNDETFREQDRPAVLTVDGYRIEIRYVLDDNFYVYVRLDQPDGNTWHGWSGYGVGAGLEDCGYGYSTSEAQDRMSDFWHDALKVTA